MLRRMRSLAPVDFVAIEPEPRFRLVQDDLCVRVHGMAGIVDQAVGMVGMQMGEKDRLDHVRCDADRAQIFGEPAERRPHACCRLRYRSAPIVPAARAGTRSPQSAGYLSLPARRSISRLVHAEDDVERSRQHAIAERGHLDVADLSGLRAHAGGPQELSKPGLMELEKLLLSAVSQWARPGYHPAGELGSR